jgi:hypothetical protein
MDKGQILHLFRSSDRDLKQQLRDFLARATDPSALEQLTGLHRGEPAPKLRKSQIKDKFRLEMRRSTNEGKTTPAVVCCARID